MGAIESYGLRLRRRAWRLRALRKSRALKSVSRRTDKIASGDILVFATVRNEQVRLPYFLAYYRGLGVDHFLMVDNGSNDGTAEYLRAQPDVSLWRTGASYRKARFGMDWMNWLLSRYGHDHWCLTVDADEFFVYPFCDTRGLPALADWLEAAQIRSFGTLLLDMYPKGPVERAVYHAGQDPFEIAPWFDSANYMIGTHHRYRNLWIQGGPRARAFFSQDPTRAPALNKIPFVKWNRRYVYANSTHSLLPRGLNLVYDDWGGEKASGCLLHAKFLHILAEKSEEEVRRGEHYAGSREYNAYRAGLAEGIDLWTRWSERYTSWRQLDTLGLMSTGNWA